VAEHQRSTGSLGEPVGVLDEKFRNSPTDGPAADKSDPQFFHHARKLREELARLV
jgi:hypothetical protein